MQALEHYHQAIPSSSALSSCTHSDRLLYLYFLLLIFAVSYSTQSSNSPHNGLTKTTSIELVQELVRIARNRQEVDTGGLQSCILRYVLHLDTISSFVYTGSGGFVEAFLNGEVTIPDLESEPIPRVGEPVYPTGDPAFCRAVHRFSKNLRVQYAKLSQLASRFRSETRKVDWQIWHDQIQQYANKFQEIWDQEFLGLLSCDIAKVSTILSPHTRVLYDQVCVIHPILRMFF